VQSPSGVQRCALLWQHVGDLNSQLVRPTGAIPAAIIPISIGDETRAFDTAAALRNLGILIPAIRYPTVARGRARLRLTLSAAHTEFDLQQLADAFRALAIRV
jgi:7-keto-8-aminopelargonate synthetase-like enzyme